MDAKHKAHLAKALRSYSAGDRYAYALGRLLANIEHASSVENVREFAADLEQALREAHGEDA